MFSAFGKRNIGNFRGSHLIGKNMYCERTAMHNSHYFVIYIWSAVISHVALYREITTMHAERNLRTANLWHLCRKRNSQQIICLKPHEHFLVHEGVGLLRKPIELIFS